MNAAQVRAILALPFNVLVTIPALVLWTSDAWQAPDPGHPSFWLALLCFAGGLTLMTLTIRLFGSEGQGTLAPWQPPRKLVVRGIYRHVRNPMISGVLLNLVGEVLLFRSRAIATWLGLFFLGNLIYMPLSEEPALEERFGEDYRRYKANVPRWIPRLRPYTG